mmetsp:Transcript_113/g.262  ORF Transcript_113/g.262 Transcript_113/m.262 type:complete len:262 (+) Transcript_113:648-1433(+)
MSSLTISTTSSRVTLSFRIWSNRRCFFFSRATRIASPSLFWASASNRSEIGVSTGERTSLSTAFTTTEASALVLRRLSSMPRSSDRTRRGRPFRKPLQFWERFSNPPDMPFESDSNEFGKGKLTLPTKSPPAPAGGKSPMTSLKLNPLFLAFTAAKPITPTTVGKTSEFQALSKGATADSRVKRICFAFAAAAWLSLAAKSRLSCSKLSLSGSPETFAVRYLLSFGSAFGEELLTTAPLSPTTAAEVAGLPLFLISAVKST